MANKSVNKVYIDPDKFKAVVKQHSCSIRRLGTPTSEFYCGYHERTFRRVIKIGYMSFDVFRAINSKIDISECVIKDENNEIVNMFIDNLKLKQELKDVKTLLKDLLIKIDVLERELQID
jgi:hypothetical protein